MQFSELPSTKQQFYSPSPLDPSIVRASTVRSFGAARAVNRRGAQSECGDAQDQWPATHKDVEHDLLQRAIVCEPGVAMISCA